ncbi:polyprenyl synthetase family protein [Kribbella sp. NPDC050470]|uniref:polyprenyl synthetase family protein n=1 Tax=unclassified Kribbella TaxID=2644121 RepID=UPI0037A179E1
MYSAVTTHDRLNSWFGRRAAETRELVVDFAARQAADHFTFPQTHVLGSVLNDFVGRGKFVRSTFAYLGWRCGQPDDGRAAQAAASLELLHAFALMQDDVMDDSEVRRGAPAVHAQLANWAARRGYRGQPADFGRSAAVLLSDLCLIWAERMLREAGLGRVAMDRGWRVYDLMRAELAVGQFGDLLNEASAQPALHDVLDVARRKSGNYTVRRPLELGAALAGCSSDITAALGRYGEAIGEAFQLRDDLLGVFGDPAVTGKPVGDDLFQGKATTVIVAAHELAENRLATELERLAARRPDHPEDRAEWVRHWQDVIRESGAEKWAEESIAERVERAVAALAPAVTGFPRDALVLLADQATRRSA